MVGFLKPIKIGQKLVEYAKIQTFKCDILRNFQAIWVTFNPIEGVESYPKSPIL